MPGTESWLQGAAAGAHYVLATPRRSPDGHRGSELSRQAGSSLEFKEHRNYQPGDDLRRIDWNVYARTEKLTVKLYHQEVHPHLEIVLDGSLSMNLPDTPKAQAAFGLAAMLCTAAANARFTHQVWLCEAQCMPLPHGHESPMMWSLPAFSGGQSLLEALLHHPISWSAHGVRVLISDLLWPGAPSAFLRQFAGSAAQTVIVQVCSEQDLQVEQRGSMLLIDSETGAQQEVMIDAALARDYQSALHEHQELWHQASRQSGTILTSVVAEQIVQDWHVDALLQAGILRFQ
ncbi:MAG: DUF58 domain-containing protein [Myxococcota bacterium]